MKKFLLLIFLFVGQSFAQLNVPLVIHQTVDPSGSCTGWQVWVNDTANTFWYCSANSWFKAGSGATPITGTGTANKITKWTGLTAIGNSSQTDNGTNAVLSPNGLDVGTTGVFDWQAPNNAVTGTTANFAVCDDGSATGAVIICPHASSTTNFIFGTATSGANGAAPGTTGNTAISTLGYINWKMDGTATSGHYAQGSSTIDGELSDVGASKPTNGQQFYFIFTGCVGAACTAVIRIATPDELSAAQIGGGGKNTTIQINGTTSKNIANFNSTTPAAGANTLNIPFTSSNSGNTTNIAANVSITGNTTKLASFTGATTAARCIDTDANGNLQVTASDCTGLSGGTATYLAIWSSATAITTSSTSANQQLTWDNVTNFGLGIGTTSPAKKLDIECNSNSGSLCELEVVNSGTAISGVFAFGAGATIGTSPTLGALNGIGGTVAQFTSCLELGNFNAGADEFFICTDPAHTAAKVTTFNNSNSFGGGDQIMEFNDHRLAVTGGVTGSIGGNSLVNVPLTVYCCLSASVAGLVVTGSQTVAANAIVQTLQNTAAANFSVAFNIGGSAVAHEARFIYDVGNTGADNWAIMDTGYGSATSRPIIFGVAQKLYLGNAGSGTIPSGGGQVNFENTGGTIDVQETGGVFQSPNTSGTNVAAADVIFASGTGTGNASVGHVKLQSPALGLASGTGAETEVTRWVSHTKAGSTTSATATTVFNVNSATNTAWGVDIVVHVDLISSTPNVCGTTERFSLTGTNNNGAFGTVNIVAGTLSTLCSTGTLTLAVTATAANPSVVSVTPTWATITSITSDTITTIIENPSQQDLTLL